MPSHFSAIRQMKTPYRTLPLLSSTLNADSPRLIPPVTGALHTTFIAACVSQLKAIAPFSIPSVNAILYPRSEVFCKEESSAVSIYDMHPYGERRQTQLAVCQILSLESRQVDDKGTHVRYRGAACVCRRGDFPAISLSSNFSRQGYSRRKRFVNLAWECRHECPCPWISLDDPSFLQLHRGHGRHHSVNRVEQIYLKDKRRFTIRSKQGRRRLT
ncbi:hypothetical protein EDD85DRAFT_432803 [Armillaria nabsnona]|nr:hypothetical protein EDD85DRAFT_432803 [Armillaria nabsnona]